ncbi:MAG TPA: Lrp/AsnC family transcriptional regulator [Thermodesulfobacteriota bacterium]
MRTDGSRRVAGPEAADGRRSAVDEVDEAILRVLRRNARLSQEQIGHEINLSRPAVHERMRRLEARGVIHGYTVRVDWAALGLPFAAFVAVKTEGRKYTEVERAILDLEGRDAEVEESHTLVGEWCLLVKVRAASSPALQRLLDRIREVPGVKTTRTTIILSSRANDA